MEIIKEYHLKIKINLNILKKVYYYLVLSDLNFNSAIKQKPKDIISKLFKSSINFKYLSTLSENETKSYLILLFFYNFSKEINAICDENDQQTIKINPKLFNNNEDIITKCFYLSKLINSDFIMVWYTYEFNLIDNLMNILYSIKKQKKYYKQIFLGKLIYDIIDGYQNSELYNEDNLEKIEEYYKEIKNIVNESVKNIKNVVNFIQDVDELLESYADEFYCNFFDQYVYLFNKIGEKNNAIEDILIEIELINIHPNEILTNKIIEILDIKKNKNLKDYEIRSISDLFDKKKIEFLYYIMKYFIKDYSNYLNTIEFLEFSKNNILKILLNSAKLFSYFNNNKNKINNKIINNIEFIIKRLINDSYLRKFKDAISLKNLEELLLILDYYKYIQYQNKTNEINTIKNIIKNNEFNDIEKTKEYLKDLTKAKQYENKGIIIYYYCKILEKNRGIKKELTEKQVESSAGIWDKIALNLNNNKFKFKRDVSKAIYELFTLEELKKIIDSEEIKKIQQKLKLIFKKETIDLYINHYKKTL